MTRKAQIRSRHRLGTNIRTQMKTDDKSNIVGFVPRSGETRWLDHAHTYHPNDSNAGDWWVIERLPRMLYVHKSAVEIAWLEDDKQDGTTPPSDGGHFVDLEGMTLHVSDKFAVVSLLDKIADSLRPYPAIEITGFLADTKLSSTVPRMLIRAEQIYPYHTNHSGILRAMCVLKGAWIKWDEFLTFKTSSVVSWGIVFHDFSMRWLMIRTNKRTNQYYAMVVDNPERGDDGQPHPMGVWEINASDYRALRDMIGT